MRNVNRQDYIIDGSVQFLNKGSLQAINSLSKRFGCGFGDGIRRDGVKDSSVIRRGLPFRSEIPYGQTEQQDDGEARQGNLLAPTCLFLVLWGLRTAALPNHPEFVIQYFVLLCHLSIILLQDMLSV